MNHLAHLLLAGPTPESRLGNLAADYINNRHLDALPPLVLKGVRQHRQVDAFTDRHPVVFRSLARLDARWGWYKGILVDVYFDHVLATNWAAYCPVPLRAFVTEVNADLLATAHHLPEVSAASVRRIAGTDRLLTYSDLSGVAAALTRITHILRERIPNRVVDLVPAVSDLSAVHAELESDFAEFFPMLKRFSEEWVSANSG